MIIARRAALVAAAALGLAACTDVTQEDLPAELVFASFASPNIPTPNDLALAGVVTRLPTVNSCGTAVDLCGAPPNAQVALLCAFRAAGGFPSDQEVPISIPLVAKHWDAAAGTNGAYVAAAAPAVDLSTVTAQTVSVYRIDVTPPVALVMGTDLEAASTAGSCTGTTCTPAVLTIRKKADATGSRRWPAGARITFAVRGGASGVKAVGGAQIAADSAVALAIPNRDLTKKENQPLGGAIPDSSPAGACGSGSNADEIALLENVRNTLWNPLPWCYMPTVPPGSTAGWNPVQTAAAAALCDKAPAAASGSAFGVITAFPYAETASLGAFSTAPSAGTMVLIDSGSGVAPLPIDLLRTDADGTVVLNAGFGPAAPGLDTLDGFSTTAMLLAPTSATIDASTVTAANVFLYKLGGATPERVTDLAGALGAGTPAAARYVTQPTPIVVSQAQGCPIAGGCSSAIGLQPAITAPVPGVGTFYLPPLEEGTSYAVVITDRVKSATGAALVKPTVAKILLDFTVTLAAGGVSFIPGVNGATATGLQNMRAELEPVWAVLPAGTTKANVVTAYTFRTQTFIETALSLSAAPYGIEQAAGAPVFAVTGAVDITAGLPAVPPGVSKVFQVTFRSYDGIDKNTGAFRPTLPDELAPAGWTPAAKPDPTADPNVVTLSALVAVPTVIAGSCPAGYPGGATCAPLAVVGHGINGSKTTVLAVAAELAGRGYIAVATDFPLHGDRNWCRSNADCTSGGVDGTCTPFTGGAGQGDPVPPGLCTVGTPKADGSHYFVSANFFRIRDAFRQNLLDQSVLVMALARQLPATPLAAVLPAGSFVDPRQAHYLGISLGSISGTSVVATNPRITRATFDVGGGTFSDVAINSPAFKADLEPVFAALIPGFTWAKVTSGDPAFSPAIAARFLQLVSVAKWVLDPADPVNFASHVSLDPLPNLLAAPGTLQAAKPAYGQISAGDTVVPNDQNELLYALMGATTTTYDSNRPAGADPSGLPYEANSVPHGIIGALPPVTATNPVEYVTAALQVRADATDWLIQITPPATRTFDLTP